MPNLFEKLGGNAAVEVAVELFYKKILSDPLISHFFDYIDMKQQRAFLTVAFGGPNSYSGRDLRNAHAHLNLKEEHFNAVAGHLQATLEELNVDEDLIDEVMKIAAKTHDDVLNL